MPSIPAIAPGRVAVITGAASGIGLATAKRCAGFGMKMVLADLGGAALDKAADDVAARSPRAATPMCVPSPPTSAVLADVQRLKQIAYQKLRRGRGADEQCRHRRWRRSDGELRALAAVLSSTCGASSTACRAFAEAMAAQGTPAADRQHRLEAGHHLPARRHRLQCQQGRREGADRRRWRTICAARPGCKVTAHLLIPGHVWTGITGRPADAADSDKPKGAWTPDQVVDFMLERMAAGDFYILCPDNDVSHALDARRIQWAADDIIQNRPALVALAPGPQGHVRRLCEGRDAVVDGGQFALRPSTPHL